MQRSKAGSSRSKKRPVAAAPAHVIRIWTGPTSRTALENASRTLFASTTSQRCHRTWPAYPCGGAVGMLAIARHAAGSHLVVDGISNSPHLIFTPASREHGWEAGGQQPMHATHLAMMVTRPPKRAISSANACFLGVSDRMQYAHRRRLHAPRPVPCCRP